MLRQVIMTNFVAKGVACHAEVISSQGFLPGFITLTKKI